MQGYQRSTSFGGSRLCTLNPGPIERLAAGGYKPLLYMQQPVWGRGCPAVPVCPGHVRPLHPYPPSRRRR